MFADKEINAMAQCSEIFKDLDKETSYRVIKYIVERYNIVTPIANMQTPNQEYIVHDETHMPLTQSNKEILLLDEIPSIMELKVKNIPKSEPEWILCFAYMASKKGTAMFSKSSINEFYKEAGKTTNNLAINFDSCIKKDWIKPFNKNEYSLKEDGLNYAIEVFKGKSITNEKKSVVRKPKKDNINA